VFLLVVPYTVFYVPRRCTRGVKIAWKKSLHCILSADIFVMCYSLPLLEQVVSSLRVKRDQALEGPTLPLRVYWFREHRVKNKTLCPG